MSKFHIDKNGKPAPCRATKRPCPLGGAEIHFDTAEEAQAYADQANQAEFGILSEPRKVKATSEVVKNLYVNARGSLDPVNLVESVESLEDFENEDVYPLNLQECADDLMFDYERIEDEEVRQEFLEAIGYNDWLIVDEPKDRNVETYIYGEGLEGYLEDADSLVEIRDGKVEYSQDLVAKDELEDILDDIESMKEEDPRVGWEADYRKMVS